MQSMRWSSSSSAAETAVPAPVFEILETSGSVGSADKTPSAAADDLLVFGKRTERLRPTAFRAGIETVIGVDERVRISDTEKSPWRMIAVLELIPRPPLTTTFIGTGWFIGPKTMLTAGHCVYSKTDFGGWIGTINVSPGRNGDKLPFKTYTASRFSALTVWQETADADFDIGCIHLDDPIGDEVGYFKIASYTDADLENSLVNISGYPVDRGNGREQYFHANRVLRTSARRIYYDVDTYGGQSGSPVWYQAGPDQEPVGIAVHAYGVGGTAPGFGMTANSGPRLIPEIVATIKEWLGAPST
jgi:glutamyl endopeptidase